MTDTAIVSHPARVSVVIATLGGASLKGVVEALNLGSIVPAEILVCMPPLEASRGIGFAFPNVRILPTSCRGQVAQRAEGFKQAENVFVMQLDDDILVSRECVEHLAWTLQQFPNVAVAPTLINSLTSESVYRTDYGNGVSRRIFNWLMNGSDGYREGTILRSGFPVGVVPDGSAKEWQEVEWLAGGCVMHHKGNLILENYFPFSGKAYCEDMIHSHLLAQNDVRLLIDFRAQCTLEVSPPLQKKAGTFLRETYNDFIVRRYYMSLSKKGAGRMYIFYFLLLFRYMYLWFARKIDRDGASPENVRPRSRRLSQ